MTSMKNEAEILALCEENLAANLKSRTVAASLLGEAEESNQTMIAYIKNHLAEGSYLTCEDFPYTGRQCCSVCHDEYPDEMSVVRLPDGRLAWICCSMRRTIYHQPDDDPGLWEKMLGGEGPKQDN